MIKIKVLYGISFDLGLKRIPVNFCPFCGRDLHEVENIKKRRW